MTTTQEKALKLYEEAHTARGKLNLYLFAIWMRAHGIPVELHSLLEKQSGYIHAYALVKSGFLTPNFKARRVAFSYNDRTITLDYGDPIFFRGICGCAGTFLYSPAQVASSWPIKKTLAPLFIEDAVFVDLGATAGEAAMLAVLSGVKTAHAYEPYPFPFNLLEKNVEGNSLQNHIKIFNEAVGGANKDIYLDAGLKDTIGSGLSHTGKVKVKEVSLGDVVRRINGKFTLKCNVEGTEREIFESAAENERWLKNCVCGRIAWHSEDYPTWLLERLPKYLKVKVNKRSPEDAHPYVVIIEGNSNV